MRVVVVGDVSGGGNYHLGDEAMSEVAITELKRRGGEVTLVAGDPKISGPFYGVDAVPRFGFRGIKTRNAQVAHLKRILEVAKSSSVEDEKFTATIEAVENANAVVIAGGGNLNSSGLHHVFERLALKRLAEHFNIPLYVSSQTVGPHLQPEDRKLVAEIASYARVFGARERATAALVRELVKGRGNVVQTLDDAILLEPTTEKELASRKLSLPERFVVGSFTYHAWSTGVSRQEYYAKLAAFLDRIVDSHNIDVVLLPHMGTLDSSTPATEDDDQFGHDEIAKLSCSERVISVGILSARDTLAITSRAEFTVSTRYHPVIFGAGVGVTSVGIVTSYYSATRMRGALANIGMEAFAIPFEACNTGLGVSLNNALRTKNAFFNEQFRQVGVTQKRYQASWWDGIAADIEGTGQVLSEDLPTQSPISWGDAFSDGLLDVARIGQEGVNLVRLNSQLAAKKQATKLQQDHKRLSNELESVRKELEKLRQERTSIELAGSRHSTSQDKTQ